jgi:hypothetical protein
VKRQLEDTDVNKRKIKRRMIKKRMWVGLNWLRIGTSGGYSHETSGSITSGE